MQIHTIGIDLGKAVFHLVGLNLRGEALVRKKCSRTQLLQFTGYGNDSVQNGPFGFQRAEAVCFSV
jgi:hypothetical protein